MKGSILRISAAAAAVGLFGWAVAGQLDIRSGLGFVFPERISERTEFLTERLKDPAAQGAFLLAIEGGDRETRQSLGLSFADALRKTGVFERVENGAAKLPQDFGFLFENRYLLGPPWKAPEEFSAQAIAASLQESFALLGTSPGQVLKRYLPRDPTGRASDLLTALAPEHRPATEGGVWTSGDGARSLLLAQAAGATFDLDRQEELLAQIRESFDELKGGADYRLLVTGPPAFAVATRDRIRSEVRVLSAISFGLLVALILAGFRKPSLILLLGLPMGIGVLAGLAAVQAVFGFVHGITLAFGACLVGIAMDYPLHVLAHASKDGDTARSAREVWPTLRLGAVTSVAAFVPFMLADFPGLAQIGLFVGAGLAAAVLSSRYLFPLLLPAVHKVPLPDLLVWRLATVGPFLRLPLLLLTIMACVVLLLKWDTVWETDLAALSPAPREMVTLDRELRSSLGAPDPRYLVAVKGGNADEVLRREERLRPVLHRLAGEGRIAGWRMLADILPSAGEQQRRAASIPDSAALKRSLEEAVSGTPFRTDAFKPFLADMARMREAPPVTAARALESGAAGLFRPLLSEHDSGATGIVAVSGISDPVVVERAIRGIAVPGAEFIDLKAETNGLVRSFLRSAGLWLLASLGAVLSLLYLGLRDWSTVLRVVGPVLISMTVALGMLAVLDIPVSMFHILSLILVAGLGMDYGLFFARHGGSRILTFRAVLLCNLTTATVFLVMAFSTIPVLHGIGLTVAVGSFLALVATAAFARSAG